LAGPDKCHQQSHAYVNSMIVCDMSILLVSNLSYNIAVGVVNFRVYKFYSNVLFIYPASRLAFKQ